MAKIKNARKKEPVVSCENGRMTINCKDCTNSGNMTDSRCVVCICEKVKNVGEIDTILIRSSSDVAYCGESASLIRELASIYSMLTANLSDRRGARCKLCKKSFSHMVEDFVPLFPEIDIGTLMQRASQVPVNNEVCGICVKDSRRMFDNIEEAITTLQHKMSVYQEVA